MTRITFLLSLIVLISCNSSESNCSELKSENVTLKNKLDSLESSNRSLAAQSRIPQIKIKKKSKSKTTNSDANKISYATPIEQTQKNQSSQSTPKYSGQCMTTTKKGTRCSRSARSGGYCWQHGG